VQSSRVDFPKVLRTADVSQLVVNVASSLCLQQSCTFLDGTLSILISEILCGGVLKNQTFGGNMCWINMATGYRLQSVLPVWLDDHNLLCTVAVGLTLFVTCYKRVCMLKTETLWCGFWRHLKMKKNYRGQRSTLPQCSGWNWWERKNIVCLILWL